MPPAKGTYQFMERVEAAFRLGYPLTIREIAAWAGCNYTTALSLTKELKAQEKVVEFKPPNTGYHIWLAVTGPIKKEQQGLCLIAARIHNHNTGHNNLTVGANFVECRDCGKHAHVGTDLDRPLIVHGAYRKAGKFGVEVQDIRPQDF